MIDGHPLVRLGVRETLRDGFQMHESETRAEAVELIRDIGCIDVAIVDLRRRPEESDGELNGVATIRVLRRAEPGLGIVAHGERPERHAASVALQAGATAYVARTADPGHLLEAAHAALAQERFVDPAVPSTGNRGRLTRRQRQILQLLANGGSTALAARELDLSQETVKTHTKRALGRLGACNRTHGVAIALRESLID